MRSLPQMLSNDARHGAGDSPRLMHSRAKLRRRTWMWLLLAISALPVLSQETAKPTPTSAQDVLQFLNQTIDWYHQLSAERQIATEPSDVIVVNQDTRMADQVVRQAFDFARGEAQLIGSQPASQNQDQSQNPDAARYQALGQFLARLTDQSKQVQGEIDTQKHQLETATGRKRVDLQERLAETQSELDLLNARKDAVHTMVDFVSGASASGFGASGLRAQIEALGRSVAPEASRSSAEPGNAPATTQQAAAGSSVIRQQPSGIWGLAADLFALSSKNEALDERVKSTDALIQNAKLMRAPLISALKDLSKQGDQLATEADTSDAAALVQQRKQIDALTAHFKQVSSAALPLNKQGVLLGLYKSSLTNWQSTIRIRYREELKGLFIRLAILLVILAFIFGLAEVWRRTIFRYVQDVRRRYQFLLMRRILLWFAVAVVIAFAFASQLGSVATFAGLLTAGVAVALQNVILSIAGYFMLIGKYGIRTGDRVQIGNVTGEVIDVGLIRLHVMELGGEGLETPTGRVVGYSNSIIFQPTAGMFKQIPGTHFVWHEVRLTLAPESDYHLVHDRLMGAVETVFAEYREEMERQHRQLQRTVSTVAPPALAPKGRLRLMSSGLEAVIRYPVDLRNATEIDDRVTRELMKAIDREPRLTVVGGGAAAIKITTDLSKTYS
jgi:small-conductance mechanosensitive channel